MSAPAGPCEGCGGPQQWTVILDEVYVRCVSGCLPLPLEGVVPPPGAVEDALGVYEVVYGVDERAEGCYTAREGVVEGRGRRLS